MANRIAGSGISNLVKVRPTSGHAGRVNGAGGFVSCSQTVSTSPVKTQPLLKPAAKSISISSSCFVIKLDGYLA